MQTKDIIAEVIKNLEYDQIKDKEELERKVRINHSQPVAKEILARFNIRMNN